MAGAQRTGGKAAGVDKAIGRLDSDAPDDVREPWHLQLSISEARRAGDVAVSLAGAVISRGEVTLGPVSLIIGPADRIRITGPNGSGKTTLVDALLGRAPLTAASAVPGRASFSASWTRPAVSSPPTPGQRGGQAGGRQLHGGGGADSAGEVPAAR